MAELMPACADFACSVEAGPFIGMVRWGSQQMVLED